MRTKSSIKNTIGSFTANIFTIFIGLIAQAIFIKILGTEYLGINGLFNNIISMLGIVELGLGSAVIYNLYKPIAQNDTEKIKSLMLFYKKSYRIIAFIVLIIGLGITPFLPYLIDEVTVSININLVYILFVVDIVCSYLLAYKRSILYADQKNYLINFIHICYLILLNTFQLIALFLTKNFYIYLIIKIIMRIIENILITLLVNRMYSYLNEKDVKKIDKNTEKDIFIKIKSLFFHKIGAFVITGTDNIIITKFLGLVTVGLYSNYYLIIIAVQTLFGQIITSTTASLGNLLVTETKEKNYEVFKHMRFLNFWFATFASTAVLIIMDSFIKLWIGKEFILSKSVLIILVIILFQNLMRSTYQSFKEAAGIFYEDRFVPLVEATVNIIISLIAVRYLGLVGVFIGTFVSSLCLWGFSYPKYVYKKLFNRSYYNYFKETCMYIILFTIIATGTYYLSNYFIISKDIINFFKNCLIAVIIPNLVLFLVFIKTDHIKYYFELLKKVGKKDEI